MLRNYPIPGLALGWVGIQHGGQSTQGSLNIYEIESGNNRTIPLPGRPGFFAETTRPGVVLVGLERTLVLCDLLTGHVEADLVEVTQDERVIINDGVAIPNGILFGTKDLAFSQPIAALYHFDIRSRGIRTVREQQTCSNGKFLQRDGDRYLLIDIDSTPRAIHRYEFDGSFQEIVQQSLLADPDSLPGFPDGLRPVLEHGQSRTESILVAFYNPDVAAYGIARQFRLSDGAALCEWRLPDSPRVTCPEFIERDGQVKVIFTTAVEGMTPASSGAGCIYIADVPDSFRLPPGPPLLDI